MKLRKIYAHLDCCDLTVAITWFEALFDRSPDARPMAGLAEWHHGAGAGFQLFENAADAGRGTLTLIVDDLRGEAERLNAAGLRPGEVEPATRAELVQLRDPDGNRVVLVEPAGA